MKFVFIAKHRGIWPVAWLCEALGVSRSGFHAWLTRWPSSRVRADEMITAKKALAYDVDQGLGLLSPSGRRTVQPGMEA